MRISLNLCHNFRMVKLRRNKLKLYVIFLGYVKDLLTIEIGLKADHSFD